jgi:hypothetical protein
VLKSSLQFIWHRCAYVLCSPQGIATLLMYLSICIFVEIIVQVICSSLLICSCFSIF